MIQLPTDVAEAIRSIRDAAHDRASSIAEVADSDEWASRPKGGGGVTGPSLDTSWTEEELSQLDEVLTPFYQTLPNPSSEYFLDAKCGILFDRATLAEEWGLHDHG